MKRQVIDCEKVYATHASDKGHIVMVLNTQQ